ncbi:MAG: glutathione S-transferase family protein [Pseudomonadota bacterium]
MWTLLHLHLDAHSRIARLALHEKRVVHDLAVERAWDRRPEFIALNPAGTLPTLVETGGRRGPRALCGVRAILGFLDDTVPDPPLAPRDPWDRAEAQRLFDWFADKMQGEAHEPLVGEKAMKRLMGDEAPRSDVMRAGRANLRVHMGYVDWLAARRDWLAGEAMSAADLAAAAQISCLDHLGDIAWGDYPKAKAWYAKLKSRPSLRRILEDHIPGGPTPPRWYADPDF